MPWIALLDPDVTTTATDGLYLVYLYDASIQRVYLSMNQGATQHQRRAEERGVRGRAAELAAIGEIAAETALLRELLGLQEANGIFTIDLGSSRFLPEAYEAGNIVAVEYNLGNLPSARVTVEDLERFMQTYQQCVTLKDNLAANRAITTSARSQRLRERKPAPELVFKPKDDGDYLARIRATQQRRSRKHETLVGEFGAAAIAAGKVTGTNVHPRDLVVRDGETEWLIEAKTVGPNAEIAVREAIGQLYTYRYFYYGAIDHPDPKLLALFSAPIGAAFERLLEELAIEYVCRVGGAWVGSMNALDLLNPNVLPERV